MKTEWHKMRNFAKMRISSMEGTINSLKRNPVLTLAEKAFLNDALYGVTMLLKNWESHNAASKKEFERGTKAKK